MAIKLSDFVQQKNLSNTLKFETTSEINQGRPVVKLLEPVVLQGVTIPKGFQTDFASVPWFLTWIFPVFDETYRAALLHDYLCATGVKRTTRSTLFLRQMRNDNVKSWKRRILYLTVRYFPFSEVDGGLPDQK